MNKIDARSISVYTRQMVRLAATSGIYGLAVCASTCFMTDIKLKKVEYIHQYIIQENSRLVCTFPFGIYFLFFSLSFYLSFILARVSFLSFSLSVFPKHMVFLHSLLQRRQKLKYPNAALSVILKKRFPPHLTI